MRGLLEFILGPKCTSCERFDSRIHVCEECVTTNYKRIRNLNRCWEDRRRKLCAICGESVVGRASRFFCYECIPVHPDDTHMQRDPDYKVYRSPEDGWWSMAVRLGGYELDKNTDVSILNCQNCGGLLVMRKSSKHPVRVKDYNYYKKGERKPTSKAFYCDRLQPEELESQQANCRHELIKIIKLPGRSYEDCLSEVKDNPNLAFFLDDALTPEYLAAEMSGPKTVKWCWKCGREEMESAQARRHVYSGSHRARIPHVEPPQP